MITFAGALTDPGDRRDLVVGQVTAVDTAAARVTVAIHDGSVYLPATAGTYAVGDLVLVARSRAGPWWVMSPVGTAPAPPPPSPTTPAPPPVAPPPPPRLRTVTVTAVQTGTYRGGWRSDTSDLYQGDYTGRGLNTGAAFYRNALVGLGADTSVDGTRIVARVRRLAGGSYAAQSATLWSLAQRTRPSGAPTRVASFTGPALKPGQSGSVTVPDSVATALLSGSAGGIGCYVASSSPYMQLAGRAAWSAAMSLSVTYAPG